jgi:hypothetical protein
MIHGNGKKLFQQRAAVEIAALLLDKERALLAPKK